MGRISAVALQRALEEGRRKARRYGIQLTLHYSAMRRMDAPLTGTGESINISRTGILFRADKRLQVGDSVLLMLDWPATAPDGEPLKALLTGHVVRARSPLVALAVHTHKLLRETEARRPFDKFWGPAEPPRPAPADNRPVALVVDDDSVALSVSMILVPQNWAIERASAHGAADMFAAGDSRPWLLVTSDPALLDAAPPDLPVILTVDPAQPVDVPAYRTRFATLAKPILDAPLRALISQLCPIAAPMVGAGPV